MLNNDVIFILAPHTDDGELGCGATIAKYKELSKTIYYIAFSICSQSLPEHLAADTLKHECLNATKSLGIKESEVIFLDFDVRHFQQNRQEILESLVALNKKYKPGTVYIPAKGDIHQDHQAIYQEGVRAFKYSNLLGYELPWNNKHFQPNYFESISSTQLEAKIHALQQYGSQKHRKYMSADFIRSLATVRGIQAQTSYAEAFEIYNLIR